jgi:uncharacterized repeat protein (TIGR01451 family)
LAGSGALVIALMVLTNPAWATLVTDSGPCDVTVASNTTSADCTLTSGAVVSYIGSSDTARQASGTGLFDPFVRLQASPTEQGFNTDAPVTLDAKTGKWTHAIKVSAIPVVDCDGSGGGTATCWELFVDINDSNTNKRISLNDVQIFFTDSNLLSGYTPGPPPTFSSPAGNVTTEEYSFHGDILINDVNQGSGRGDLRYLVPTFGHTWDSSTWFVLYSRWGVTTGTPGNFGTGTYVSDGGFEEWKVRKAPAISIVKTANPVGPVSAGTDIGFDITVSNTGAGDATNVTISDPLPAGGDLDWSLSPAFTGCSITGAVGTETLNCSFATLAAGGSIGPIHITSPTTAADCATVSNTATVASANDGGGSTTASVEVTSGALLIKKESTKGTNPLVSNAGAVFCYSTSTGCTTTTSVTDTTDGTLGDEDTTKGEVCVSGLAPGTYYVNETSPPTGYAAAGSGEANQAVTVVNGTNCTSPLPGSAATATFTNAPLADIQVNFRDGGSLETTATIGCDNTTGTSDTTAATGWDTTETVTDVEAPTVVTCTITIDP